MRGRGDLLTARKEMCHLSRAPASSLTYPAILVLEFLFIRNESLIALPWGSHLPPSSKPSTLMILLGVCGAQLTHLFQWSRMSL